MKDFCRDYAKLCKDTSKFYKKHWKGVTVMNVVVLAAEMSYIYRDTIKNAIENKFGKKEDEGLD